MRLDVTLAYKQIYLRRQKSQYIIASFKDTDIPMTQYIFPFKGLHPKPQYVSEVIAPPYDVVLRSQAKALVKNKPNNFLHITRAEIDLADTVDDHDDAVYLRPAPLLQA